MALLKKGLTTEEYMKSTEWNLIKLNWLLMLKLVMKIFGVEFQVLSVPILVDDDQWEPDEEFFIKISLTENKENSGVAKIGKKHIMTIRLVGLG